MSDVIVIEKNIVNIIKVNNKEIITAVEPVVNIITAGSQGPEGIPGADGAPGEQGPQGIQGIQGPAGNDGEDGDAADIALEIDNAAAENPLLDTDSIPLTRDGILKKGLWSSFKATLKTYFDGLYLALTGGTLTGGLTITNEVDAVNATKITDKDGNAILSVDTVNDRVGIGTNTPVAQLHTVGAPTGSTYLSLFIENGATPHNSSIIPVARNKAVSVQGRGAAYFMGRDLTNNIEFIMGTSTLGAAFAGAMTDHELHLRTNNVTRITILRGTGKVGVNTTVPDKQLEINSVDGNCLRLTFNDNNGSAAFYTDFNVDSAGNLTITASGGLIKTANDVEITDATKGIILKSPDGSRFRVTVGNDGVLTTTEL